MTMCPDEDWVPDKMCEVRTRAVLPAVAIEFCINCLHNIIDFYGRPRSRCTLRLQECEECGLAFSLTRRKASQRHRAIPHVV